MTPSEAPLPYRIPTQTSPSHSHIAAQSSLSFASSFGFLFFKQGHAANALSSSGLKITLSSVAEAAT